MFLAAATLGLVINFLSGLSVLQQSKDSTSANQWVSDSYIILQKIDSLKLALLNQQINKNLPANIAQKIIDLKKIAQNRPAHDSLVTTASILEVENLISQENTNAAMESLLRMSAAETALLSSRIGKEIESNELADQKILLGSVFDCLLILLFVGFYIYERKKSIALQAMISKTLTQVEKTNQQMRLTLEATHAKFKTVVHDLKNPLGSIKGFAELLRDEAINRDSVIEMSNIIQRISNNTLALVGTVLQEAKAAEDAKQTLSISDSLQEVCLFLKPIALEKDQSISIKDSSESCLVFGSRQQLADIFFNVIGNALKFSPAGSEVKIVSEDNAGYCEIRVFDQGPGFAKEDFAKLYVPEEKLSAKPTGHESSTGIGLYSAKRAVDILNGQIEISNNPDKGACVTLRFPKSPMAGLKDIKDQQLSPMDKSSKRFVRDIPLN